MYNTSQISHLRAQIPKAFASQRIQIDRFFDTLIETNGGRRMENNVHTFFQYLQIWVGNADIGFRNIAGNKHDFT